MVCLLVMVIALWIHTAIPGIRLVVANLSCIYASLNYRVRAIERVVASTRYNILDADNKLQ